MNISSIFSQHAISVLLPILGTPWLLTACSPTAPDAWFPLDKGHAQTYRINISGDDSPDPSHGSEWTLTALGSTTWQDTKVWQRRHSEGVVFYLQQDARGIRRVAQKVDIDPEPTADPEPRWVLKAPYAVGTEWTTPSVPYLLKRKNEHPREMKHTHKVNMLWRIEATDDEVTTPNGTHKPCLRVSGLGELNLYTDPVNGFTNVPIVGREWYCKGVGLVKFEREETVPRGFMTGGKLTAEWVR